MLKKICWRRCWRRCCSWRRRRRGRGATSRINRSRSRPEERGDWRKWRNEMWGSNSRRRGARRDLVNRGRSGKCSAKGAWRRWCCFASVEGFIRKSSNSWIASLQLSRSSTGSHVGESYPLNSAVIQYFSLYSVCNAIIVSHFLNCLTDSLSFIYHRSRHSKKLAEEKGRSD